MAGFSMTTASSGYAREGQSGRTPSRSPMRSFAGTGQWRYPDRNRPVARPDPELRGLGTRSSGRERPLLADRRPRRRRGLHRRQRLPTNDQQLSIRRRDGDCPVGAIIWQDGSRGGLRGQGVRAREPDPESIVGRRSSLLQGETARSNTKLAAVRELYGFAPWYAGLGTPGDGLCVGAAMDPNGFFAALRPDNSRAPASGLQVELQGPRVPV